MRHILPALFSPTPSTAHLVLQFAHPVGRMRHTDEYGGRNRHEGFHFPQLDDEWIGALTDRFDLFQRLLFRSAQASGRKDSDMGGEVCMRWVQLTTQVLHKLA